MSSRSAGLRTMVALAACAAALLLFVPLRAQAPLPLGVQAELDRLVAAEHAKDGLGGATIGVVMGGSLVWAKGYGLADIEAKTPAAPETVYRIGSVTKMFTALMLLQLVEQGVVHLSDPIEKYLPEISRVSGRAPGAPPIALVQVATMTSGLAREPDDMETFLRGPVSAWESVLLSALARTKYRYEPGTRFFYSNIGYAALGAALSRAAGRPYVDYVRERILAPLGMTHTDFEPVAAIRPSLAKGYEIDGGTIDAGTPAREHNGRGYKVPNGALYSTVGDLARYVALELGEGPESVLKRETIKDNLSRVESAESDLTSGYGIGFQVERRGDLVMYGHGGSVAGYRAGVLFDPKTKTGVIVLSNVGGGKFNVGSLAARMLDVVARAATGERAKN